MNLLYPAIIFLLITFFSLKGGVDYRDEFQTIEKLPNETTKDVRIPIINDDLVEGTETFTVFITTAEQALAIPLDRITITIIDDDREGNFIITDDNNVKFCTQLLNFVHNYLICTQLLNLYTIT